jgi:CRP-like cAMP-binding protein
MSRSSDLAVPKNRLLSALPVEDYQRLLPHLEPVSLSLNQVLYEVNEPITHVYFPSESIVSLVAPMEDGATIEVGLVGQEGMAGILVILGGMTKAHRAIVQVADSAVRLNATVLKAEFDRGGALQTLLLRYLQTLLTQATQTLACNRFHPIEERLARWLLVVQDSLQTNEFLLTQEFIGQMLGVRRSSVTVAAGNLSQANLINYTRGRITILDRAGLEDFSCECYGIIRDEIIQMLGGFSR